MVRTLVRCREKVEALIALVRAMPGPTHLKDAAAASFDLYIASFDRPSPGVGGGQAASAPALAATLKRSLRGRSLLLTYNWDFFAKALPDGNSPFAAARTGKSA